MKKNEQERIFVYRRIIKDNDKLNFLMDLSDNDLLEILNSTVLPNSINMNSFKYSLFFNSLFNNKETEKVIKKFSIFKNILTRVEKDIFKFGFYYGFNNNLSQSQYVRFVSNSLKIEEGELKTKKRIPAIIFDNIFHFVYKVIKKGERNGQFPRL